ncbi:MAG: putative amidohydrolase YtcJ/uncharacterized membrane protein YdjX (TVP38/TMEM64 family) [Gammaproteobacteria bacterium]|jgi:predicted amidohydrolase YtcJ/uncharacterized membrane protein YdjX (TVP38/TMEM64 family)
MNKNLVKICAVLLVVMVAIGYLMYHYSVLDFIDTSAIAEIIVSLGWLAIPAFITFGALFTSVGLPRQVVAFIGGYIFGTVGGVALGTVAAVLGAILTFYAARWLARPFVLRKYPRLVSKIDHFTRDRLFLKIILIRFLPFGTNLATNLATGAAATPVRSFALASLIGYIPQMTIFAMTGQGVRVGSTTQLIVAAGLFLISIVIGSYLYRQHHQPVTESKQNKVQWHSIVSAGFAMLSLLSLGYWAWFGNHSPHRVFINAKVLTVNQNNDIVEAVSIRHGIIEAVGSNESMQSLIDDDTLVSDLAGNTLIPGFIDAHSHFPSSGLMAAGLSTVTVNLRPPPVGKIRSIEDIRLALLGALDQADADNWVIGLGYDDSLLAEQRHPTRLELDQLSSEIPIYLWHGSGHMGVANSAGLAKLNLDEASTATAGGVIGRDVQSGLLNGLLQEQAAPSLGRLTDSLSLLDNYQVLQSASDDYSQQGITTANSGAANTPLLKALSWAARLRLLPFRLVVSPRHDALGQRILDGLFEPADLNSDWFQVGPVKLFVDGSPQGYTAYLTEPYFKQPTGQTGYRGFPVTEQSQLIETVSKYQKAGIQLAIHGNGDAAIDNIIEVISLTGQVSTDDARTILLHAQMTRNDQLDDMSQLGITPSFFNTHTYYWGEVHRKNAMGPERADHISPAGSAEKIGLRFSFHSDAPVTPINPLQLIWSGVNRETLEGNVLGEAERVPIMSALRAVTIDAAWQVFQEGNRGSIEVGKFADLVILSGDLLSDKAAIRERQVLETLVAGEVVFSATE